MTNRAVKLLSTLQTTVERLHRIMADMLRCSVGRRHDRDDPVADLLAAWGLRPSLQTTQNPTQFITNRSDAKNLVDNE